MSKGSEGAGPPIKTRSKAKTAKGEDEGDVELACVSVPSLELLQRREAGAGIFHPGSKATLMRAISESSDSILNSKILSSPGPTTRGVDATGRI